MRVDVVSVVTPTPAHFAIARDFLSAAAHVLVEKPVTHTPAEARELIALAKSRQRILQVGHLERFNAAILAAEPHLKTPRFIECHRLAPYRDRCCLVEHDIFASGLEIPVGSLDAVVSVFAICHARGSQVYAQLYRRIYSWLKPGGIFICYDHVLGDSPVLTALNALGWHRLLRASQTAAEAREGIVGTYQEDSPLSLREHLALLGAAGFSTADVLHKRDIFAIYLGVK